MSASRTIRAWATKIAINDYELVAQEIEEMRQYGGLDVKNEDLFLLIEEDMPEAEGLGRKEMTKITRKSFEAFKNSHHLKPVIDVEVEFLESRFSEKHHPDNRNQKNTQR